MTSHQDYQMEVAERYLEYIHIASFPSQARDSKSTWKRLTTAEIPFWKDINLGKLQASHLNAEAEIFVNITLTPEDYNDYLASVVPYAQKIVLIDPLATLYEWKDRSVVSSKEFKELLNKSLEILLPLYPLIEKGILSFLPQPTLWSNKIDDKMWPVEKRLLSRKEIWKSLLTDYEKGLDESSVVQRWLDAHPDIPEGWSENPKGYATVNIVSGTLYELINGIMLSLMLNGNITTSSVNDWNHLQHLYSGLMKETANTETTIAEILPLTKLPYVGKPDWSKLVSFRNESDIYIEFRKQISDIVSNLKDYGPNTDNATETASMLSQKLNRQVDTLINKRKSTFNAFQPALSKTVLAGISAILGSQPLALALTGYALFDACKTIKNFNIEKIELKKNPLYAVFCDSIEE